MLEKSSTDIGTYVQRERRKEIKGAKLMYYTLVSFTAGTIRGSDGMFPNLNEVEME
jgi:hypothetical protein